MYKDHCCNCRTCCNWCSCCTFATGGTVATVGIRRGCCRMCSRGLPAVACVCVCVHTEAKGIKEGGVVALEDSDRLAGAINCRNCCTCRKMRMSSMFAAEHERSPAQSLPCSRRREFILYPSRCRVPCGVFSPWVRAVVGVPGAGEFRLSVCASVRPPR